MKVIIQRVSKAQVSVNGEVVSFIGRGIVALVGIFSSDSDKDVNYIAKKLLNVRVFEDGDDRRWAKSTRDMGYEILCISQFTICHTMKGNKPDFRLAMPADNSETVYRKLVEKLKVDYKPSCIKEGVFGAHMVVSIENDGPVTLTIESAASCTD